MQHLLFCAQTSYCADVYLAWISFYFVFYLFFKELEAGTVSLGLFLGLMHRRGNLTSVYWKEVNPNAGKAICL